MQIILANMFSFAYRFNAQLRHGINTGGVNATGVAVAWRLDKCKVCLKRVRKNESDLMTHRLRVSNVHVSCYVYTQRAVMPTGEQHVQGRADTCTARATSRHMHSTGPEPTHATDRCTLWHSCACSANVYTLNYSLQTWEHSNSENGSWYHTLIQITILYMSQ